MSNSELEDLFAQQLDALGLTGYLREYPAFVKGRKFRWDFAGKAARLLAGDQWRTLRKVRIRLANGIRRDYEKNNLEALN